jgi:hypothetical protein
MHHATNRYGHEGLKYLAAGFLEWKCTFCSCYVVSVMSEIVTPMV